MAEYENGYCTGCGYKSTLWGHRPYCWRKTTMMLNVHPTQAQIQACLWQMERHWRIRSLLLCKREHMYYQAEGERPEYLRFTWWRRWAWAARLRWFRFRHRLMGSTNG